MDNIGARDLKCIWHPCSQMKDHEVFPLLEIKGAQGPFLELLDGRKLIDAVSSWWCKSLGHSHPRIRKAVKEQIDAFEHVIFANTTNALIVELSEKLARLSPGLDRVFYAGDGSMAVEIALKMAIQAQELLGNPQKNRFAALENGYHGESAGALGVSQLGLYRDRYASLLPEVTFISDLPYVSTRKDPLWEDCSEYWPGVERQLNSVSNTLCGIILEPILQGAGGMKIYSADFLRRIRKWTEKQGIFLISDEILTGFGRTGTALAGEHADIRPDFLCLSKGLTAGWMPFSCTLTTTEIFGLFYDDYQTGKSFLHSNTYSGHILGAAAALEALKIYEEENIFAAVSDFEDKMIDYMREAAEETGLLENVRGIGMVAAADLKIRDKWKEKRPGFRVFQEAVKAGAFLRPLGSTIYWLPPLNTGEPVIRDLKDITVRAVKAALMG